MGKYLQEIIGLYFKRMHLYYFSVH